MSRSILPIIILAAFLFSACKTINNDITKQGTEQTDELIEKCARSFKECKDIATTKYDGLSISLIKMEKFEDLEKAEEFYDTWSTPALSVGLELSIKQSTPYGTPVESYFPIVLIATKIAGPGGQFATVLICDTNGTLTKDSKGMMLCSR